MGKNKLGIFIFRRDLRLYDNTALNRLATECNEIILVFIFDPRQILPNDYRSLRSIVFMLGALRDLSPQLNFFYGNPSEIVAGLCRRFKPVAVGFNKDYTPFAKRRDAELARVIKENGAEAMVAEDVGLWPVENPENVYQKFTPYAKKVARRRVKVDGGLTKVHFLVVKGAEGQVKLKDVEAQFPDGTPLVPATRAEALRRLREMAKITTARFEREKDILGDDATSHLSAALKFGLISAREAWKVAPCLRRQLLWREFYMNITNSYDISQRSMKVKYDKVKWKWDDDRGWFARWKEGRTGFPIVDACMRCLAQTGYLPNRGRLIVASFLVKTLLIHWRLGEQYFAQTLVDYDWSNNYHGWLWVSGGGADSQPYFRVFSPWRQQLEFDPAFEFTKRWLPEVRRVPVEVLRKWETLAEKYLAEHRDKDPSGLALYPPPMVNFAKQTEKAIRLYKAVFTGKK